jgi:histidine triad (HIT) family protein|tara:strand:+ start:126 stop:596 length:471 start_codon:yes stop_codon:yes gene_type:complete
MKSTILILIICLFTVNSLQSQSIPYQNTKNEKIENGSVFTRIVNRELPATIEYEDDEIIAFVPLKLQAPVHLLIVPKKEIYTINDIDNSDIELLGKMMLVAKKLAKEKGISETGYRLSINVNENAGQSVFHIHMHLLGGKKLGPMVTKKSIEYPKN